jgi:hypothetical protein
VAVQDEQRFQRLASALAEECAKRGFPLDRAGAERVLARRLELHADHAHTDRAGILQGPLDDGWPRRLAAVLVRGGDESRPAEPGRTYSRENARDLLDALTTVVTIAVASAEHDEQVDREECERTVVAAAACASGLGAALRDRAASDVVVAGSTVRAARGLLDLAVTRVAGGSWRPCWCGEPMHHDDVIVTVERLRVDLLLVR